MNVSFKNLKTSVLLISLLVLASCEFSFSTGSGGASKENDIAKKTTIKKNELDFKELSISGGSNKEKTTEFIYGEKIEFEFSDLKGLTEENNLVYPGLQVLVLGKDKDTIVYNEDLYEGKTEGIKNSNVKLSAWMTLGDPIHSKSQYEILLHIWDKKGEGTIDTSLKVDVIPNNKIDVKNSDFSYNEIYLYSDKRGFITDNKVVLNENIHFVFEGLDGFQINNGKVSFGTSMEVRNSFGIKLLEEDDLFKDVKEADVADLKEGLSPYIFFDEKDEGSVKLKCRIKVWDKKSNRSMTVYTNLILIDEIEW